MRFVVVLALLVGSGRVVAAATEVAAVQVYSPSLGGVRSAVLVDLDGDGDGDVVTTDASGVRIFRRDGQTLTAVGQPLSPAGGGGAVASGDVDGDGDPDLLVCSRTFKRKRVSSPCRLLLNRIRERGQLEFEDVTDAVGLSPNRERAVPLLVDCDISSGRCSCATGSDCPGGGNSCQVIEGLCTNECIDGRCLGTCELQLGGG